MKKIILSLTVILSSLTGFSQLLPKSSPLGKSSQIVGASEISLEYSRPGVKGREIFGKLLPYGELWRLGANSCTKFSTTDSLKFGEQILAPGTYALFAIPNADKAWEIIFNSDNNQSGTGDYDSKKDVFRIQTAGQSNSFTETLTLGIEQITDTSASLVMLWENIKLSIPFNVNTKAVALNNIEAAIKKGENLDKVYGNAADFYFNFLHENKKAMELVEKSLKIKESYRSLFLKARILESEGKKEEAIQIAKKALGMAEKEGATGFAGFISSTIANWSK